jgi:hypothetical protein
VKGETARHQWLAPVFIASQEAENRRLEVQSQPRQTFLQTLSRKTLHNNNNNNNRDGGVAQGVGPEFKLQYHN